MPDPVRRFLRGEGGRPGRVVSQTLQGVSKDLRYRCRKVYEYTERAGKHFPLGDLPTVGKSPSSNGVGLRLCMCAGAELVTVRIRSISSARWRAGEKERGTRAYGAR